MITLEQQQAVLAVRRITEERFVRHGICESGAAQVRMVETSMGAARVLEYGFSRPGRLPLHVDLFGGGFIMLNAGADERINLALLEHIPGRIVSVDYPRAPEHPYPDALHLVYEVIAWYARNGEELSIDWEKIGVGGRSAGGNLAAALCLLAKTRGTLRLCYQTMEYPPLDLYSGLAERNREDSGLSTGDTELFTACYVGDADAHSPYVSPIAAEKEQLAGLPPALMIAAGKDMLYRENVEYVRRLREAGVEAVLREYPESSHSFTYSKKDPNGALAIEALAGFINRHI